MLPIKTLIKRIRRVVHDTDAITYDDDEVLDVINQGVRYIRRVIVDNKPEMLASKNVEGLLKAGERSIDMPYRPLSILYVRAGSDIASSEDIFSNDKIYHNYKMLFHNKDKIFTKETITKYRTKRIQEANISEVFGEIDRQGIPEVFFLTGEKTVNFYPAPQVDTYYEIMGIEDMDNLTVDDNTPLLNEFDDLLVEFANVRLSIENEYDVSADSQILSNIHSQIVNLLHIPPTGVSVQGYWNASLDRYGKPLQRTW